LLAPKNNCVNNLSGAEEEKKNMFDPAFKLSISIAGEFIFLPEAERRFSNYF